MLIFTFAHRRYLKNEVCRAAHKFTAPPFMSPLPSLHAFTLSCKIAPRHSWSLCSLGKSFAIAFCPLEIQVYPSELCFDIPLSPRMQQLSKLPFLKSEVCRLPTDPGVMSPTSVSGVCADLSGLKELPKRWLVKPFLCLTPASSGSWKCLWPHWLNKPRLRQFFLLHYPACQVASFMSSSLRPLHCSPPGSSVHGIL